MNKFICESKNTKSIYTSLQMAVELPINILVYGNDGLGKKTLLKEHFSNTSTFFAYELEEKIINNRINLDTYTQIIIFNIHELLNKKEFFEKLKHIRLLVTSTINYDEYADLFALKLKIKNLSENIEDLNVLKLKYIQEAKELSGENISTEAIDYDLSANALSLKQSIYKSCFTSKYNFDNIDELLKNYILEELKNKKTYKEIIGVFEIPLLKASQILFPSQVKIADALNINRVTLRKKLQMYRDKL
jgi:DNA-binding protein Fis